MVHNRAEYENIPEKTTTPIHIGKISLNYFRIAVAWSAERYEQKQNEIVNEMQAFCGEQHQQTNSILAGIDSQPNNKVILFITFFFALFHSCLPASLPWKKENVYDGHMFMLIRKNQSGIRLVCGANRHQKYATI